jgi:hypothetical protein
MLKKRPLWAGKGHYMGFNLGAFRQNTQLKRFFSTRTKSDGFTGVFLADLPAGNVCNITPYALVTRPLFNPRGVFHKLP